MKKKKRTKEETELIKAFRKQPVAVQLEIIRGLILDDADIILHAKDADRQQDKK